MDKYVRLTTALIKKLGLNNNEIKKMTVTGPQIINTLPGGTITGGGQYAGIFFVTPNGDNGSAVQDSIDKPYATINAAADAAYTKFLETNVTPLVYVIEGTFNEASITRNGVDMYFADDTLVYFQTSSIIDDLDASLSGGGGSFNIYGKGSFHNLDSNTSDDRNAINLSADTKVYVQAKVIGDMMCWNSQAAELTVEDAIIPLRVNMQTNSKFRANNCTLYSPPIYAGFIGDDTQFQNCTFKLLSDYTYNVLPELWSVTDVWNATTLTINNVGSYLTGYQAAGASNAAVVAAYANIGTGRVSFIACVEYVARTANTTNFNFINCDFIIEREYCNGVLILQSANATGDQFLGFKNCRVIDNTTNKDTGGVVVGKGGAITTEIELDAKGITSGATTAKQNWSTYIDFTDSYTNPL